MQYHGKVRLVLDTCVMVAAIRSSAGASNRLLQAALKSEVTALLSVPLMLEYEAVLSRQEHLTASGLTVAEINALLDALAARGEAVRLPFHWRPMLRDANDDMVLEVAVNGRAQGLVTFNSRDFVPVAAEFGVRVMSPQEALHKVEDV